MVHSCTFWINKQVGQTKKHTPTTLLLCNTLILNFFECKLIIEVRRLEYGLLPLILLSLVDRHPYGRPTILWYCFQNEQSIYKAHSQLAYKSLFHSSWHQWYRVLDGLTTLMCLLESLNFSEHFDTNTKSHVCNNGVGIFLSLTN